jgi:membrane associated rhomboid family serine protease
MQLCQVQAAYSQSGIDVFGHAGGALGGAAYFYNMAQAARSIPLLSR